MDILEIAPQVGPFDAPSEAIPTASGVGGGPETLPSWPEALARLLAGSAPANGASANAAPPNGGQPVVDQAGRGAFSPPAAPPLFLPLPAAVFFASEPGVGQQTGPPDATNAEPSVLPPWLAAVLALGQSAELTSTAPGHLVVEPRIAGAVLAFDGEAPGRTETQSSETPEAPAGLQELLESLHPPAQTYPEGDTSQDELLLGPVPEGLRSWMLAPPDIEQSVSAPLEPAEVTLSPLSGLELPAAGVTEQAADASLEAPPLVSPLEVQPPAASEAETPVVVPLGTGAAFELEGESSPPAAADRQHSTSSASRADNAAARGSDQRPQAPGAAADVGESRAGGSSAVLPVLSAATGVAVPNNSLPPTEVAAAALTVTAPSPTAGLETRQAMDGERVEGMQPARADAASSSGPGVATAGGRTEGTGRQALPPSSAAAPADFADRLARTLIDAHQAGRPFSMRLHPPELGLLQIELSSRDGVFTARLDVETSAARQAILEQLPQLREALAHTGHNVERIDVQVLERQDDRSQHHSDRRESSDQRPRDDTRREHNRTPRQRSEGPDAGAPRPHVQLRGTATMETLDIQI